MRFVTPFGGAAWYRVRPSGDELDELVSHAPQPSRHAMLLAILLLAAAAPRPADGFVRSGVVRPCARRLHPSTACAAKPPAAAPATAEAAPSTTDDALSGLVVALANVPTSIAFANIAGISPLDGLWSSVVLGAVVAGVGGRPGLIAGAAGVVAVPLAPLVAAHGPEYLAPAVLLSAALQMGFAASRQSRLVDLITPAVMAGFLNGLGCLLARSQLSVFAGLEPDALLAAGAVAGGVGATVVLLPRLNLPVPAPLVAVVGATAVSEVLDLPVKTLAALAGPDTFAGGLAVLPHFSADVLGGAVPFDMATAAIVAPTALSIALISVLETLLSARVVEDASGTPTDPDRLLLGAGVGNGLSAALGGFGGCGLIPQTLLNVKSGGRGTASAAAYAASTALAIVVAAPLLGAVPLAALAGLMLTVAFSTVQWEQTAAAFARARSDGAPFDLGVILLAASICFNVDMATGIGAGVLAERVGKGRRGDSA